MQGIANTSTNRIAQHAGMSIGSLYRYFADKDAIVEALQRDLIDALEQRFTRAVLTSITLDPQEAFTQSLTSIVETLGEHRGLARAFGSGTTLEDILRDGFEVRLQLLSRAFLLHHLGARPDSEIDSRALILTTTGLAMSYRIGVAPPQGIDTEEVITLTAQMLATWLTAAVK